MAKKTFVINVDERAVDPTSHRVPVGDDVECTINKGKAVVVFEPGGPGPVMFLQGPSFNMEVPALAKAQTPGSYPFSVCFWYEQGGKKEHEALQMVLIIDP
jgi:hypothetical protein